MQSKESDHERANPSLPPLEEIGPRHIACVRRLLSQFCIELPQEREDLVQEILLQAYRSRGSHLDPPALLSGITSHVFFRWHQRARRTATALDGYAASRTEEEVQQSPEEAYQEAERVHAVQRALQGLPADQRPLFEAVVIHGRPVAEVTGAAGASTNTGYTRLRRARDGFATILRRDLARRGIAEGDL